MATRRVHRRQRRVMRRSRRIRKQRGGLNAKAIMKHINDFNESKSHPGIYFYSDEDHINKGYAMIVGPRYPKQTDEEIKSAKYPYEECLFFFSIEFPDSYPEVPPKILFLNSSIDPENTRFHPNLYEFGKDTASGKVCLSILGTWAGPGWDSKMNLESTLLTVQSLLGPNPIHNEPGFERLGASDSRLLSYNQTVLHKSIEFSYNVYKMAIPEILASEAAMSSNSNYSPKIKPFIAPFIYDLKDRMWSAVQFYIQRKLDKFIPFYADGVVNTTGDLHHKAKHLNFRKLLSELMEFRISIPREFRSAAEIEDTSVAAALVAEKGAAAVAAAAAEIETAKAEAAAEAMRIAKLEEKIKAINVNRLANEFRSLGYNNNLIRNMKKDPIEMERTLQGLKMSMTAEKAEARAGAGGPNNNYNYNYEYEYNNEGTE